MKEKMFKYKRVVTWLLAVTLIIGNLAQAVTVKAEDAGSEADTTLAYYVNCGGTELPEGESYGIYNNDVVDQPYSADGEGGYHWGYDKDYSYEDSIKEAEYAGHTVRMIKGNDGAELKYYFELPKGNYNVEVDVPYCGHSGNRVMDVSLQIGEGEKSSLITGLNTTNDIGSGSMRALTADITVTETKQVVTISAVRSNNNAWAPFLGYIKITVNNKLLNAMESAKAVYEAGNQDGIYTADTWMAFAEAYEEAAGLLESDDEAARLMAAEKLKNAQASLKRAKYNTWLYDFEDGIADADLVVNKSSISAYSGQPVYGEGRNGGKALRTGSYGLRLNKKNIGGTYTINAWVKSMGAVSGNTPTIFLGHNNPEKWIQIAGNGSVKQCKVTAKSEGVSKTLDGTVQIPIGEWVMHTIQSNGTTTTVYENGEIVAQSDTAADVLMGGNQDVYLCVNFWDGQFRGLLDDVTVSEKCLSEEEVYKLYDARDEETILSEDGVTVPETKTLVVGAEKQIRVTMPKGLKSAKVTYLSDKTNIASVSADGVITGVAPGTAEITTAVAVGNVELEKKTAVTVRGAEEITDEGVSYFVDCGNGNVRLASDDLFGQYNRVPDQPLGQDTVTGKTWGWKKIGNNNPSSGTNIRADEDSREYTYRAAGSGSDFCYQFELPANVYQIEITIPYFLSGSNTRTFEVLAGNGAVSSGYETIASNINTKYISGSAKTYTGFCTSNGEPLRISFLSDSDAWGPIVSAIKITPAYRETYVESLRNTLTEAKTYRVEDYSDASFAVLTAAINNAEQKLDSIANAKEAKELEDDVKAAVKGLVRGVNAEKELLKALIAHAKEDYKEAEYTENSYTALKDAVKAAEEKMDFVTTVSQAMKLEDKIQKAIGALEKKPAVTPPDQDASYKITFNSAGGSKVSAQTIKSGQKAVKPKNPTRGKYLFKGWYGADGKKYSFNKAVTADVTLTAKWTKVTVGKPQIISAKNKKIKQCTIQVKKVSGAAGYQYVYSANSSFKKSVKKADSKAAKVTLKKLKKGRTYYIKVRSYKYDSKGSKVYGKYSVKKKITIKK